MDQRRQKVDEAAEKVAKAIEESLQAVTNQTPLGRRFNHELTQEFFDDVMNNLRGDDRHAYVELLDSMVSHLRSMWRGTGARPPGQATTQGLPPDRPEETNR
jgi:hypothetical protein